MSIRKELNGTYTAQCRVQDWTGKTVHKKKRGFLRKKDAKLWEQKMLAQRGQLDVTVREFTEIYFDDKKSVLKERTIDHKRDIFNKHILPYFGDRKIDSIKAPELIQWQNTISAMDYKPTYLNDIQKHLSALFSHACKVYDLQENPCKKISRMGKSDADKFEFWTIEEYNEFIQLLTPGTQYYALFETLFWTGIRCGEALALTKKDIDVANHQIIINKTYYRKNGKDIITTPKTEQSVRVVDVSEFLIEELEEYMQKLYGLQDDDRIFPVVAEAVQHKLKREIERGNLKKIRVHDLRHSHVAYLIDQGVEALIIKERLGHKDIRITLNTYGHLYPTKQKELAQMLNRKRREGEEKNDTKNERSDCSKSI